MARGSRDGDETAAIPGGNLKDAFKRLPKGAMQFAFGLDESRRPILLMHKTRSARALRNDLKNKLKCKRAAHGKASAEGTTLRLDVEGPPLPAMDKAVKRLLREEKIDKFKKAAVYEVAAGPDEAEQADQAAEDARTRALQALVEELEALETQVGAVIKALAAGEKADQSVIDEYSRRCSEFVTLVRGSADRSLIAFAKKSVERAKKMSAFVDRATTTVGGPGKAVPPTPSMNPPTPTQPPAPTAPPAPSVPSNLSGSVGSGGRNSPDDVEAVQTLLNQKGASLEVDGQVGPKTIRAISEFQKKNLGFADGRVDPGGRTWAALSGGASGGGAGGANTPGTPTSPPGPTGPGGPGQQQVQPPPHSGRDTVEDEFESGEKKGPPKAIGTGGDTWFDAETEISTPFGSVKIETNAQGKVVGVAIVTNIVAKQKFQANIGGPYAVGFEIAPLQREIGFKNDGPVVAMSGKIGCGGAGFLLFGAGSGKVTAGLKGEIGLSVTMKTFTASANLSKLKFEFAGTKFPLKFSLNGDVKAGPTVEVGEFGTSGMIVIGKYEGLLIATIAADFSITLEKGPGLAKLGRDIQKAHDTMVRAIEMAKEDPGMVGTGATPFTQEELGNQPQKAKSIGGTIDDAAKGAQEAAARMEVLQTLRQAERVMESAFKAGWKDPSLLGKANALAQKDEARAREYYGQAWTQRALAKQAHDSYGSPLDNAPIEILQARTAQAHDIAQKFNTAVGLFKQGDSRW